MLISTVIVSYNTKELLLRCLEALYEDLGQLKAEVIVVDNGSTDESHKAVRENFPDVEILLNVANIGFGAANNQAFERCTGRFVLMLNSDAFLRRGALGAMIRYLEGRPRVAVVGPKLRNANGTLQASCYRFPTPTRAWTENLWLSRVVPPDSKYGDSRLWSHDREKLVDWVTGACLLVRREAIEEIGGIDEDFFMYSEETDWQRRMTIAGWQIGFTPEAEVTHLGGASGVTEEARVNENFFRSLDHYVEKHYGSLGLLSFRAAMVVGCLLRLPLWIGCYVLRPARRKQAASKIRLRGWLIRRQVFAALVTKRQSGTAREARSPAAGSRKKQKTK
jgi:hypothetical protein